MINLIPNLPNDVSQLIYGLLDETTYKKMVCVDKVTQFNILPFKLVREHIPKWNSPLLDKITEKYQDLALQMIRASDETRYQQNEDLLSDLKNNFWTGWQVSICMSDTFLGNLTKKVIRGISNITPLEKLIDKQKAYKTKQQELGPTLKQISQDYLKKVLEESQKINSKSSRSRSDYRINAQIRSRYLTELLKRQDIDSTEKLSEIERLRFDKDLLIIITRKNGHRYIMTYALRIYTGPTIKKQKKCIEIPLNGEIGNILSNNRDFTQRYIF